MSEEMSETMERRYFIRIGDDWYGPGLETKEECAERFLSDYWEIQLEDLGILDEFDEPSPDGVEFAVVECVPNNKIISENLSKERVREFIDLVADDSSIDLEEFYLSRIDELTAKLKPLICEHIAHNSWVPVGPLFQYVWHDGSPNGKPIEVSKGSE